MCFHLQILNDQNLVVREDGETGVGLRLDSGGKIHTASALPLWLTSDGHDHYDAINKPIIMDRLISDFKEEGLGTAINIGKELLNNYINKKLES